MSIGYLASCIECYLWQNYLACAKRSRSLPCRLALSGARLSAFMEHSGQIDCKVHIQCLFRLRDSDSSRRILQNRWHSLLPLSVHGVLEVRSNLFTSCAIFLDSTTRGGDCQPDRDTTGLCIWRLDYWLQDGLVIICCFRRGVILGS